MGCGVGVVAGCFVRVLAHFAQSLKYEGTMNRGVIFSKIYDIHRVMGVTMRVQQYSSTLQINAKIELRLF